MKDGELIAKMNIKKLPYLDAEKRIYATSCFLNPQNPHLLAEISKELGGLKLKI